MKLIATLMAFACTLVAAGPLTSGVAVGQRPGPYSFIVATGKERGQLTCFICDQAAKPATVVFARSLTPTLGKLLGKLDDPPAAVRDAGYKAWMTLLTTKADLDALAKWSKQEGLKNVPVGAFENVDGPPAYTLHDDADVTVMVFVKEKVTSNFAFRKGELDDAAMEKIVQAITALQ